jgi:hypothetical protein
MPLNRVPFLLAMMLLSVAAPAWGQPAPLPITSTPDREIPVSALAAPMIADPETYPEPRAPAPEQPWRILPSFKFDATVLPSSVKDGLTMTDLEFITTLKIDGWMPLTIAPYAAGHYWTVPSVPGRLSLYDLNTEFAVRPRLANWLFVDLAATPGIYTAFEHVHPGSFQMRGRGLAIIAFSENLQVTAGAMYVNRLKTKVLPAGGVIWNPSDDTRYFLVFPQPKVSHRFVTIGDMQFWGYVAGEFGGGRWEVERLRGAYDSLDYTDVRVLLGLEIVRAEVLRGHIEVGYVFGRRVNLASAPVEETLPSTIMLRAGLRF